MQRKLTFCADPFKYRYVCRIEGCSVVLASLAAEGDTAQLPRFSWIVGGHSVWEAILIEWNSELGGGHTGNSGAKKLDPAGWGDPPPSEGGGGSKSVIDNFFWAKK